MLWRFGVFLVKIEPGTVLMPGLNHQVFVDINDGLVVVLDCTFRRVLLIVQFLNNLTEFFRIGR